MTFHSKIVQWYDTEKRDLPWRKTNNPYHILVSEIMLQQTQVSRGLIFFEKWLQKFPDWETLANATNAEVIHAWAGLGYNRRALMLRDIARQVKDKGVPKNEEEWRKLKGIGPYTAAAVSVFAYKQKAFPIDTNIRRVLGRFFLNMLFPDLKDDKQIQASVYEKIKRAKRYDDMFQAIFDLANTHCLKDPQCHRCPLASKCSSAKSFLSGDYTVPKAMVKKGKENLHRNKRFPDRIYRGKILQLTRESQSPICIKDIGKNIDDTFDCAKDQKWIDSMISRLEKDGLLLVRNKKLYLPS